MKSFVLIGIYFTFILNRQKQRRINKFNYAKIDQGKFNQMSKKKEIRKIRVVRIPHFLSAIRQTAFLCKDFHCSRFLSGTLRETHSAYLSALPNIELVFWSGIVFETWRCDVANSSSNQFWFIESLNATKWAAAYLWIVWLFLKGVPARSLDWLDCL